MPPNNRYEQLEESYKAFQKKLAALEASYQGKRKGSKYQRRYGILASLAGSYESQLKSLGITYNLVKVKGVSFDIANTSDLKLSVGKPVILYLTHISKRDALLVAKTNYPQVAWSQAEEVATNILL